ncbi:MAG TPA: hypothetical protein DCS93_00610 [Microscillaceae bacterium]|nr:hypothetical protein [Microscillaceae bacterium]
MHIKSITLEHTNPSLGPHETITEITLVNSESHIKRINKFIDEARVNGVMTLRAYIEAVNSQDSKILDQVWKQAPKGELNEGETISNLHIHFEDNSSISLSDVYRRFNLTHFYAEFTAYMVEKGTLTRHKPFAGLQDYEVIEEKRKKRQD